MDTHAHSELLMNALLKLFITLGVLSVAGVIMALHYETILAEFDACPVPILCGKPGEYGLFWDAFTCMQLSIIIFTFNLFVSINNNYPITCFNF